mgnify:CR=1 FL=1|tara:strand:- start:1619 stop:1960 length:342 start_codon:yes stop_codon:yes gene_type:complete
MILGLVKEKNIKWKLREEYRPTNGIRKSWYEFGEKQLIMENHNHGRSEIGLLTTYFNSTNVTNNDININDKLKWNDTFGKSKTRFQYRPFGKPVSEIDRIFDIMIKVDELNKI